MSTSVKEELESLSIGFEPGMRVKLQDCPGEDDGIWGLRDFQSEGDSIEFEPGDSIKLIKKALYLDYWVCECTKGLFLVAARFFELPKHKRGRTTDAIP